ncbi:hypothetical protein CGMCC3_g9957 [Colletotrichum fructicola]|nr:uncharacterized protein CGMCC3_g9957 [Colletotrichum fructicola]KAE9573950.1 hypothetical protein CGMCC3_g9957 [Colletotrichum fructicola]
MALSSITTSLGVELLAELLFHNHIAELFGKSIAGLATFLNGIIDSGWSYYYRES